LYAYTDFTEARPLGSLKFKEFSGAIASEITSAQFDNLLGKNVNFYATYGEAGRSIGYTSKAPNGNLIKDIILADWLDYNMTYNIFDLMIKLPRLGYTSEDFSKLEGAIERAFLNALSAKIIAGGTDNETGENFLNGYSISIPLPTAISSADKQAGIIKNITTVGLLRGSATKFVITNNLKF
jgi:hypothetical protein